MNVLSRIIVVAGLGALIIAIVAVSSTTRAQTCGKADAIVLQREAEELKEQRDFKGALAKIDKAIECYRDISLIVSRGTILAELGRYAEARRAYRPYLDDPTADPEIKRVVQQAYDKAEPFVAVLRIVVNDPKATITVNGRKLGTGAEPVEWEVDPRSHAVVAECSVGSPAVSTVKVGAAERRLVDLQCKRPVAVIPTVSATASSSATTSNSGSTGPPDDGSGSIHRPMAWTIGAVGLVGLGLGTGFGIHAIVTQNEALSECENEDVYLCSDLGVELNGEAKTAATVSTVAFAVGAAAVVASVVLFLTAPTEDDESPPQSSRFQLLPATSPGHWGVQATGAF